MEGLFGSFAPQPIGDEDLFLELNIEENWAAKGEQSREKTAGFTAENQGKTGKNRRTLALGLKRKAALGISLISKGVFLILILLWMYKLVKMCHLLDIFYLANLIAMG